MGRLPVLKPREAYTFLRSKDPTGSIGTLTGGKRMSLFTKDISPILLRRIAGDIGLTVEEFLAQA